MSPDQPTPDPRILDTLAACIDERLAQAGPRPLVVGLCGAQGSGKSTIAAALARRCIERGMATAILSLDDLYLPKSERELLARTVHPLLRTRGVPGTHDVALGLRCLASIDAGEATTLPRFSKALDDSLPAAAWTPAAPGTRLVILEGWCVGARPQSLAALALPLNELERTDDAEGSWRRHANSALAVDYQRLFARIDLLALLVAPTFDIVCGWRVEQEHALRVKDGGGMTDRQVARFVQHYERLTRHIMAEMPERADLVFRLDERRNLIAPGS